MEEGGESPQSMFSMNTGGRLLRVTRGSDGPGQAGVVSGTCSGKLNTKWSRVDERDCAGVSLGAA